MCRLSRPFVAVTAALVAVLVGGCAPGDAPAPQSLLPQNAEGNFVLYISNQSYAISPVDIAIYIDGIKAIEGDFDVTGQRIAQHNWIKHTFQLAPGKHTIKADSKKGEASLEKGFEVKDKHWGVIDYWYYPEITGGAGPTPRSFGFEVQDTPILFR